MVLPVYGPLVSYVPDGDNSDRTNSAHRKSARGTTTAARPLVPEPAETLREDNRAAQTRESRQPVSQPPVD